MFAYCIPRNKWSFYWVKPPVSSRAAVTIDHIISVYRYEEKSVYVVYRDNATNQTKYTVNIFNAATKRDYVRDVKRGTIAVLHYTTERLPKDGNAVSCALYGRLTKTNGSKATESAQR